MNKIGMIGLGIMGKPMALQLLHKGAELMVNDINREAVVSLENEGATAASQADIAAGCPIIFIILPNGAVVQEVLFGQDGIAVHLRPGSLVVDMSSVRPDEARSCAKQLAALHCSFLDAPVSGGEPRAIDGTLAFMVGGSEQDFERALPYFNMMGSSALLVGPCGAGSTAKLTNQIIVNLNIAAVAEGLILAKKMGADPEKVYQAIRGGLAGSTVLDAKAPMMINRNFVPGGKLSINIKDIRNVIVSAEKENLSLKLTEDLLSIMEQLEKLDLLQDDHSAILKYYEMINGITV